MKRIFSAPILTIVANVRNVLEINGIESVIRNQYLCAGVGELPPIECWPTLWVAEQDEARALELIEADEDQSGHVWKCPKCGEEVEGQFDICWNCGTEKPYEDMA